MVSTDYLLPALLLFYTVFALDSDLPTKMHVVIVIAGLFFISLCLFETHVANGQDKETEFDVAAVYGTMEDGQLSGSDDQEYEQLNAVQEAKFRHVLWRDFKRVCYFRMDPTLDLKVPQIDGNLCTHIIFAFCRIDVHGNVVLGAETDDEYLRQVAQLKIEYPHLKVLVSLYNESEFNGFIAASKSGEVRERLAQSAIEFMDKYGLDGMDCDWEFPNFPSLPLFGKSKASEKQGLTQIVRSLRKAFGTKYLLTVAVAAQNLVVKASYELDKLAESANWLNVMTYDFYLYKDYTPFTGPNAPLYSITSRLVPILRNLSIDWTIRKYISSGVAREKIVMGIPTYARAFQLRIKNSNRSEPKSFMRAVKKIGGKTDEYLDFSEVCKLLRQGGDQNTYMRFDEKARVPYMITKDRTTWISYENEKSVGEKVEYAINMGLAGYMTWNLNSDNFDEPCYEGDSRLNILHTTMLQHAKSLLQ